MELGDSPQIVNLAVQELPQVVPPIVASRCVQCSQEIDAALFSFEMRLVGVDNFCRNCWDGVMSDKDIDIPYLERPKWLETRKFR